MKQFIATISLFTLLFLLRFFVLAPHALAQTEFVCQQTFDATVTITPTITPPITVTVTPTPGAECVNYGIDEHSGSNSNIISIQLTPIKKIELVKNLTCAAGICDVEGMDNVGDTVYLVANQNSPKIYTLRLTPPPPTLPIVVALSNKSYEGLSFFPGESSFVWGGSRNSSIYKIDLSNGSEIEKISGIIDIKTIQWNNLGTILYAATGKTSPNTLRAFNYNASTQTLTNTGYNVTLPGRVDAMDMTDDGYLVLGYRSGGELIFTFFNPVTGQPAGPPYAASLTTYNAQLSSSLVAAGYSPGTVDTSFNNLDAFTWLCGNAPGNLPPAGDPLVGGSGNVGLTGPDLVPVTDSVYLLDALAKSIIDRNSVTAGTTIQLSAAFTLLGSAVTAQTPFNVEWKIDGTSVGSQLISRINLNEIIIVQLPWTAVEGSHTYSFTVDSNTAIAETDETNNTGTIEFTVQPAPAGSAGSAGTTGTGQVGLTGSSNPTFAKAIELIKQGVLNISAFFAQIFRSPSVQKQTCDPTLPDTDPKSCVYQYPYLQITVLPTPTQPIYAP